MRATGTFEVELSPQDDASAPVGRMLLSKTYLGDMTGSGIGQMISKRTEGGAAAYFAIEEFSGSLGDRSGGFTLLHRGCMDEQSQSLTVTVLQGSGSGELKNVCGEMTIDLPPRVVPQVKLVGPQVRCPPKLVH